MVCLGNECSDWHDRGMRIVPAAVLQLAAGQLLLLLLLLLAPSPSQSQRHPPGTGKLRIAFQCTVNGMSDTLAAASR